jgi:hypothetical protein
MSRIRFPRSTNICVREHVMCVSIRSGCFYVSYNNVYIKKKYINIHTYHPRFIPEGVAEVSQIFSESPTFYQKVLAMRNTANEIGGKPIAIFLQSISGVSAINPLDAFYDIHGGKTYTYLSIT